LTYGSKATEWGREKAFFSASSVKLNSHFNFLTLLRKQALLRGKKDLLGTYRFEIPKINTTTYGLHSFVRYSTAKRWNDLNESVHALENFQNLKDDIRILNFQL